MLGDPISKLTMKLAQRLTMLIVAVLIASFGVQKAEATVKNTAILKGSSLENGSNNLATTAPLSIKWDTKSLIDPLAFDHSITGDATKLVVKADGIILYMPRSQFATVEQAGIARPLP